MDIRQGEIFFADLSPAVGSEQGGLRPVVVVQNDVANRFAPTVIVAAVTGQIKKEKLPTHVKLSKEIYPFKNDSIILLEQIRTIDKSRLSEKIGKLQSKELNRVKEAWLFSGGFSQSIDTESTLEIETFYKFVKGNHYEQLEDADYEFKDTKSPLSAIRDTVARYVCSFLNANGGRILYGITDERVITGIRLDHKQIDDVKLAIYDKIRGINPGISPNQLEIIFHNLYDQSNQQIQNEYVLEVFVPALKEKKVIHYINNGRKLIVRVDGSSRELQGSEIVSFVLNKYNIT